MPLLMVFLPPPPSTPSPSTKVMASFFFFSFCLSPSSVGKWGPFLGEAFFFWGGGEGLSAQHLVPPYENPRPPRKNLSYATGNEKEKRELWWSCIALTAPPSLRADTPWWRGGPGNPGPNLDNYVYDIIYCRLRMRRALKLCNDVPLRSIRALSP